MPATSVEQMVYTWATADSDFTTALGGLYWYRAPESATMPYVVYWQVDDPRPKEFLHVYGGEARLRFDVFSDDRVEALINTQRIVEKVRELRGLQSGLRVTNATVANVLTQPANIDDITHRTVDVIVSYTEEA